MNCNNLFQFKWNSHNETISYIILPIIRLNDALKVLKEGFYPFESFSVALDVIKNTKAVNELNELVKETIKDGISIVAVENTTNEIIGISANKIQKKPAPGALSFFEWFIKERCKEKESALLIKCMMDCDGDVDLFQHFDVNKLMEIMFIAVSPKHCRRGIGTELIRADLILLTELSKRFNGPEVATALWTTSYSRKIGDHFGFQVLATRSYDTMVYNDIKFSDKIGNRHQMVTVAGKKFDKNEKNII